MSEKLPPVDEELVHYIETAGGIKDRWIVLIMVIWIVILGMIGVCKGVF